MEMFSLAGHLLDLLAKFVPTEAANPEEMEIDDERPAVRLPDIFKKKVLAKHFCQCQHCNPEFMKQTEEKARGWAKDEYAKSLETDTIESMRLAMRIQFQEQLRKGEFKYLEDKLLTKAAKAEAKRAKNAYRKEVEDEIRQEMQAVWKKENFSRLDAVK